MAGPVVVLAGGTGGAKLAARDARRRRRRPHRRRQHRRRRRGPRRRGLPRPRPRHASGSPTRSTSAAGGCDGDTFHVMDALRELGAPDTWFALGDRDLAWCLERARRLADGETPTQAHAALTAALGVTRARPADVRRAGAHPRAGARRLARACRSSSSASARRARSTTSRFDGIDAAQPTPEVLEAIAARRRDRRSARRTPSISIGPILALPGMREALARRARAGRRRLPDRRRRGAQGPDRRVPGARRPAGRAPPASPAAYAGRDRRAARRRGRRASRASAWRVADTLMADADGPRAASRGRRARSRRRPLQRHDAEAAP